MVRRPSRTAVLGVAALLLAALAAAGSLAPAGATAAAYTGQQRAIIVLLDNVSLSDVAADRLPGFAELRARSSMGLTTLPLGAGSSDAAAYATIGMGSPVSPRAVPPKHANGYEAGETVDATTAAAVYALKTGSANAAGILNPDIVAFTGAFAAGGGGPAAGRLGSSLRAAGLSAALIGNADGGTAEQVDRSAMLVAMDASGAVSVGAVGRSVLTTDPGWPLGVRTDFAQLLKGTDAALRTCALVVVETGDLQRARVEAAVATPEAAGAAHARALRATDAFIQRLSPLADENTLLVIVSPSVPASETLAGRSLAPVWIAGGGFASGGALASATTRHTGVLALHDIAPTVLAHLGVKPISAMIGLPLTSVAVADAPGLLGTMLQRAGDLHSQRTAAINALILAQALLLAALCVPWVQRRVLRGRWGWVLPYTSGAVALAVLLQPAFGTPALPVALAIIAAIALAIAAALAALRDRVLALGLLSTATVGAIALDLAAGAPLARWSFLGYDLVVGARFYGVGNELEGVLIGASVVASACLVELAHRHRGLAVSAVGAGCIALIGMFALPRLGADAGGALAAAIGVGVTFYGFAGGHFTWKRILVLAAALVGLGIAGLAIASVFGGSSNSHIGRYLARLSHGDLSFASQVVVGKLRANLHLMTTSSWRSMLLAAAAAIAVLVARYRVRLHAGYSATADLSHGVTGLIAGGLAVLALNDSGVIALATLAPFAVVLVLTLIHANPAEETAP